MHPDSETSEITEEIQPAPSAPVEISADSGLSRRKASWLILLDVALFAALSAFAFVRFVPHSGGDLYTDEADYALASTRGFEANRWDRSDSPKEPDRLIAMRHYHAPLTTDIIGFAHRFGADDRTIRMPSLVAGALAIGVVYMCGLALFDRRREIAIACSLLVAVSPAVVRMATHALPWSPIILELLALLWCILEYTRSGGWGWIAGCTAALALLFVTSEVFFVAAPAIGLVAPFVVWPDLRDKVRHRALALGIGSGAVIFLLIVFSIWPDGLAGASIKMLRHYMQMRHSDSFPVNVGSRIFAVAPKWSYAYWYWNDYKPFTLCYALAIPGIFLLAAARKLHISVLPLLSLTAFLLFAAHRAHIIGPEYLAHCLPFLTLLGGYAVYCASLVWRPLALVALVALAIPIARWKPRVALPGMDTRAQISRWPSAARFLAAQWLPGDKIVVGSQPVSVAHWYLVYQGGIPASDNQFQTLPIHAPRPLFLDRLRSGVYRYAATSNMVEDYVDLDAKTRRILGGWSVVWHSDEHGTGPSRLTIYRAPAAARSIGSAPMPGAKRAGTINKR